MGNPELFTPDYATKPVTLLKGPVVNAISLVNKGANKKRFFLFKSEDSPVDTEGFYVDEGGNAVTTNEFTKVLPLLKAGPAGDEWQAVYCVVAVPGEVDSQKDVWTEEEIRKAAHNYLKESRLINYMHKDLDSVGSLVESAIAPVDMNVGGETIPKGTWFIAIEPNPDMKKMIETGDVTGVSVQGSSKREPVSNNSLAMFDMAKGSYERAVPPRPVTEVPTHPAENKDDTDIPAGTQGPGIVAVQHILGIPETGEYDAETDKAVRQWMANQGVPGKPTIATIKLILTKENSNGAEKNPQRQPEAMAPTPQQAQEVQAGAEAAGGQSGAAQAPGGPQEKSMKMWKSKGNIYHFSGDSTKTPLWVKDINSDSVMVEFPPGEDGESEVAKVYLNELYKCSNPDSHYEKLAKDYRQPVPNSVNGPYSPADGTGSYNRSLNFIPSGGMGGLSYGTHMENYGTQPQDMDADSTDDELKTAIIRSIANHNELLLQHLSNTYGLTTVDDVQNYSFSKDELWGLVSRYILGRMDNPASPSMLSQPVRRTDKSIFPEGAGVSMQKNDDLSKVGMFDYHRPTDQLFGKDGDLIVPGSLVRYKGKDAEVSSIDMKDRTVKLEYLPKQGDLEAETVLASKVEVIAPDPAAVVYHNTIIDDHLYDADKNDKDEHNINKSSATDKNGKAINVGDIVVHSSRAGLVQAVGDGSVTIMRGTKSGNQAQSEISGSEVEVVASVPASKAKAASEMSKGKAGGSMGGFDPRQYGKIRFIVRSFGKWAAGLHRVCVARLRAEHPEVFKGNEDAGCAWLKDQWAHTTKWRHGRQGVGKNLIAGESTFAKAYNEDMMSQNMHPEAVHVLFVKLCDDMGIDRDEVENNISQGDEALDRYLDELFGNDMPGDEHIAGNPQGPRNVDNEDMAAASEFIKVMKSDLDVIDKLVQVEELINKNQPNKRQANNDDFLAAMNALQLGIADSIAINDLEKREDALDSVMVDFSKWLQKFTDSGFYYAYEENNMSSLEKGWMPAGMTQGDLEDGDFAWLSDAYKAGNAPKSSGRKLPYKINGKVNVRGWHAAWAAISGARGGTDTAGGPSVDEVKAKLLRDKPKDVAMPEGVEKGIGNFGDKKAPPFGKKRLGAGSKYDMSMEKGDMCKGCGTHMNKGATVCENCGMSIMDQKSGDMDKAAGMCAECGSPTSGGEMCQNCKMGKAMPPALAAGLAAKRKRLGAPKAPAAEEMAPKAPAAEEMAPKAPAAEEMAPKAPAAEEMAPKAPAAGDSEDNRSRLSQLLAMARKRRAEMASEAPAADGGMMKSDTLTAAKIERLRETRNFLESVLNYTDEDTVGENASENEEPDTGAEFNEADFVNTADTPDVEAETATSYGDVEKDVDSSDTEDMEANMSDSSEVTMDQVVEAVNGLGEEVDNILRNLDDFKSLGTKLDQIGDLAKSLDSGERLNVIEEALGHLTEALSAFVDTADAVEGISKRLTALEGQPGSSTAAPVDNEQVIAKSAPEQPVLFQRTWGSIF